MMQIQSLQSKPPIHHSCPMYARPWRWSHGRERCTFTWPVCNPRILSVSQLESMEHMIGLGNELTSCLVSSTLFPRASLAAVARSPTPTLLSLAISVQAVSRRVPTITTSGIHTFVALLLGLSRGTLEALETLIDGVPTKHLVSEAPDRCDECVVTYLIVSIVN